MKKSTAKFIPGQKVDLWWSPNSFEPEKGFVVVARFYGRNTDEFFYVIEKLDNPGNPNPYKYLTVKENQLRTSVKKVRKLKVGDKIGSAKEYKVLAIGESYVMIRDSEGDEIIYPIETIKKYWYFSDTKEKIEDVEQSV